MNIPAINDGVVETTGACFSNIFETYNRSAPNANRIKAINGEANRYWLRTDSSDTMWKYIGTDGRVSAAAHNANMAVALSFSLGTTAQAAL